MFRPTNLIVDKKLIKDWQRRKDAKARAEGRLTEPAPPSTPTLQATPLESLPTASPRPHVG